MSQQYLPILIPTLLTLLPAALAHAGREAANGGDMCEDRIAIIRNDIAVWINQGGSEGLVLPSGLPLYQYNLGMLRQIAVAEIDCIDAAIQVDGAEKTCENKIGDDGISRIVCNYQRFMETPDADQYVLVHHEYAGLAGFEENEGPNSQYSISNQIAEYLVDGYTQKLAIKNVATPANASQPCESSVRASLVLDELSAKILVPEVESAIRGLYAKNHVTVQSIASKHSLELNSPSDLAETGIDDGPINLVEVVSTVKDPAMTSDYRVRFTLRRSDMTNQGVTGFVITPQYDGLGRLESCSAGFDFVQEPYGIFNADPGQNTAPIGTLSLSPADSDARFSFPYVRN
jgi:hypothetical protein